jgi:hypothetical protein
MNLNIDNIIKYNQNSSDLEKLLNHIRNKLVFFSSKSYYYIETNGKIKPLKGLLPSLKNCFWKDINYNNISIKISKTKKNTSKNYGRYFGSIIGTEIHKQLNDFLLFDEVNFLKLHYNLHPWAKKIFNLILKNNWLPIKSEFNIFDSKLNIGTSVDMICFCKNTGKIIAIEIKTGYQNYFEVNYGKMNGCLRSILPFSFKNCATLQLLTAMIMIVKNHDIDIERIEGHVILINDEELTSYQICHNFFVNYGNLIYNNLKKSYLSGIILKRKMKKDKRDILKTPKKVIIKKTTKKKTITKTNVNQPRKNQRRIF